MNSTNQPEHDAPRSRTPQVSIVIPTWNDGQNIGTCIESCLNQSYSNIEIIVVDNRSDDGTQSVCQSYPIELISVECGMAEARNIGFEQSNGDYIYHVDADMELSSDVVQECVDFCINQEYDALLIPEENIGGGYWSNCLKFGKRINRREQKGNLRFVDSDLYSQVGGHDPKRLSGEDWDLHRRVASEQDVKIGHIDKLVKHHVESMGFFDIISKSNTYAKSQADIPDDDRRPLDATGNIKKHLAHFDIFMLNPLHSIGYAIISIVNALMARYYRYKGDVYKDN